MKKHTQKEMGFINSYNSSTNYRLADVYGSYSQAKFRALCNCEQRMKDLNGYDGKITGANCYHFTYCFLYEEGENTVLNVETVANTYKIIL